MDETVTRLMVLGLGGFMLAGPVTFFAFWLGGFSVGLAVVLVFFLATVVLYMLLVRHWV